jgi:DNA-binding transcriptional LysR family regulator
MTVQLDDMALFARIVELGTLSAAARERNVPVSQVTRALARLEAACGARLLHRSTHGLSLTDEGDTVLAHGRRLLNTAAELQGELSGKVSGPSGWVRISVSPVLAEAVIVPSLTALYRRHPQLHVDIAADDRMADMAREGVDIALRTGSTHTDTVVARQIGEQRALGAAGGAAAGAARATGAGAARTLRDARHAAVRGDAAGAPPPAQGACLHRPPGRVAARASWGWVMQHRGPWTEWGPRSTGGTRVNEIEMAAGLPATASYRYAQRVGQRLFVAGQVPHDSMGRLVGSDDPHEQGTQCLRNLATLLTVHGFAMSDVRQLVVYVAGEQPALTAAWTAVSAYFADRVPPATLLGVARLGYPGQLVEVDATVMRE